MNPGKGGRPIQILMVEDNLDDIDLIMEALKDGKVNNILSPVKDGEEAIAYLRCAGGFGQAPRPDLILLDLHMPGMTGIDVLKELKSHHYAGGVIALSGSQDRALLQEMFRLGAVDVIGKPVDLQRLGLVVAVNATLAATA